jgi:hypothetical protein
MSVTTDELGARGDPAEVPELLEGAFDRHVRVGGESHQIRLDAAQETQLTQGFE